MKTRAHPVLAAFLALGCGARTSLPVERDQTEHETSEPPDPDCPELEELPALTGRVRDFQSSHPDFENFIGDDRGIVLPELGEDGVPVYAGLDDNPSTSGKENFDQWYRDVPGINLGADIALTLSLSAYGWFVDRPHFFPVDDQLFGNEGNEHNFHFTVELHTTFRHRGGEVFRFEGDDDLWAFVDGQLIIDLGGVHGSQEATVDMDSLGLERDSVHSLDLFYAERHTSESVLFARLAQFDLCGP